MRSIARSATVTLDGRDITNSLRPRHPEEEDSSDSPYLLGLLLGLVRQPAITFSVQRTPKQERDWARLLQRYRRQEIRAMRNTLNALRQSLAIARRRRGPDARFLRYTIRRAIRACLRHVRQLEKGGPL